MDAGRPVIRVIPAERVEGERTPGMSREQAIATEGLWSGLVRTDAHMTSGWHHHAEFETSIYVVVGTLRMESGPGGVHVIEAGPGDFVYVPRGATHRESNPGNVQSQLIVTRAGRGPAVVNVEWPAPA